MSLSEGQFHEHLGEFHRQLGLEVGPGNVTLPGGTRLPTIGQRMWIKGYDPASSLSTDIPGESGGIHFMNATLSGHSGPANAEFDIGYAKDPGSDPTNLPAAWHERHRGYDTKELPVTFYAPDDPEWADPHKFDTRAREIMNTALPPEGNYLNMNRLSLQTGSQRRGLMSVQFSPEPSNKRGGLPSRWYTFNHGTGRLTEDTDD